MRASRWFWVVVGVFGCEKTPKEPRFDGPMPVAFGDCAGPEVAWLSGPRPAAFTPEQAENAWVKGDTATTTAAVTPTPPAAEGSAAEGTGTAMALEEGKMGRRESDRAGQYRMKRSDQDPQLARQQAIEQARAAGILGVTATVQGGAFASLTGTGDLSSGFDDLGDDGVPGNDSGEMSGGFGFGIAGPGGGGTGWGTIGLGRYGVIGHGSGTGRGYGIGTGRGGLRAGGGSFPAVRIGQPNMQGDLDKNIIRRYIRRNIHKIQYCYEKQLLVQPQLAGTVKVQFFITPEGHVSSAVASGLDPDVENCVAGVIKQIQFPKPKGGGGVQVNYPFTFRQADDDASTTAAAGSADPAGGSAAGSATPAGAGSAAPTPPPNARRRLFRAPGEIDRGYRPGATNPLQAEQAALAECFRKGDAHHGAAVFELAYDAAGKVTNASVHGIDEQRVQACVTAVAKRVKRVAPSGAAERCSVAFGEMPLSALPALDMTTDAISLAGTKLATPEAVIREDSFDRKIPTLTEAVDARVKQATAATAPVVSMHGPLVVRPIDATKMKIVDRVVRSILAGGDDFVLATGRDADWQLLSPMALPVVPVPFGTGAVWNHVKVRTGAASAEDEDPRSMLSVLITPTTITLGVSRVEAFKELPRDGSHLTKLEDALKAHKTSPTFAKRADIEIAATDDVAYSDFVAVVKAVTGTGFVDWQLATPGSLSARPPL